MFEKNILIAMVMLCALVLGMPHTVYAKKEEGIAIVVNQDAISASDVRERMKLILASSGLQPSKELQEKVKPQIVNQLIEEKLKIQEATRLKFDVTQAEINEGVTTVAQQNKLTADQFRKMISSRGIDVKTLEDQVRSQLAWTKVVSNALRARVEVTQADIDAERARLSSRIGQTQYLVFEIFLAVNDAKKEGEVVALANRLVSQLRQQPDMFPRVAQQFSQSAGAAQGGAIGWVLEKQLDPALDSVMTSLTPNQVSDPVKDVAGYHILLVREKRQITEALIPKEEEIINRIGTERLDRLQRRLILDLRSAAFIETRV